MAQPVLQAERKPGDEIEAIEELEHARNECVRLRRIKDWGEDLRAAEIRMQQCDQRLIAARRQRILAEHGSRLLSGLPEAQGICPKRDNLLTTAISCVRAHSQMVSRVVDLVTTRNSPLDAHELARLKGEIGASKKEVVRVLDAYREHIEKHGCCLTGTRGVSY
jgi:hypothetical protein